MIELKQWLNSINHTKDNILENNPSDIKDYPPYIINRCLSAHLDCILYVNEMNKYPNLDNDAQYLFYLNSLRKRRRYSPWLSKEKLEDLDVVKSYYGYSNEKAKQALQILTKEQLTFIKSKFETGGLK